MNPDFISTESLMDSLVASEGAPAGAPAQEQPSGQAPQKPAGRLKMNGPRECGCVTAVPGPNGSVTYSCNIGYEVGDCDDYFPIIHILHHATSEDTVILNIYSYGGMVETGCHLINALYNTCAHTVTRAYGIVASIAAVIWCCGQERQVTDNATIMFHMPSGGCFGKTADNEEESRNIQDFFTELLKDVAKGILTDEDLDRIVTCRNDVFIPARTIRERLGQTREGDSHEKE